MADDAGLGSGDEGKAPSTPQAAPEAPGEARGEIAGASPEPSDAATPIAMPAPGAGEASADDDAAAELAPSDAATPVAEAAPPGEDAFGDLAPSDAGTPKASAAEDPDPELHLALSDAEDADVEVAAGAAEEQSGKASSAAAPCDVYAAAEEQPGEASNAAAPSDADAAAEEGAGVATGSLFPPSPASDGVPLPVLAFPPELPLPTFPLPPVGNGSPLLPVPPVSLAGMVPPGLLLPPVPPLGAALDGSGAPLGLAASPASPSAAAAEDAPPAPGGDEAALEAWAKYFVAYRRFAADLASHGEKSGFVDPKSTMLTASSIGGMRADRFCVHHLIGSCRRGARCPERHPVQVQLDHLRRDFKRKPCRYGEKCLSPKCLFYHPNEWSSRVDAAASAPASVGRHE